MMTILLTALPVFIIVGVVVYMFKTAKKGKK